MKKQILDYAKVATAAWNQFDQEDQKIIQKYFHLRPTQSGVTLVTTLPFLAMRGRDGLQSEDDVSTLLRAIIKNYREITQDDDDRAVEVVSDILGIVVGRRDLSEDDLEYDIQARMINHMSDDSNLAKALGSKTMIQFVASEMIFEQGPNRVDIVGFNGSDLFFFELKKGRTTKVKQVADYVRHYGESPLLGPLLAVYPIYPVAAFEKIKGVMVMRHSEGSARHDKWKKLAELNRISIVFYRNSLSFARVS